MSFSGTVKEELIKQVPTSRHCYIAELAAILQYGGALEIEDYKHKIEDTLTTSSLYDYSDLHIKMQNDNEVLLGKCFLLMKEICHIKDDVNDPQVIAKIMEGIKFPKQFSAKELSQTIVNPLILKPICCKRAFLRGAFLATGSMSNPEKSYHLEYVCQSMEQAKQVQEVIASFEVEAKIILRKKYYVVYIKEGEGIVELLNIMGAHVSLMNFENFRILKEMRNDINRRVNCEAANITKTVNASSKQIEDIEYIRNHYGFHRLSEGLQVVAETRLDYPEATLKELGEILNPPVGKSGVNHRLRKLSELADKLRG